MVSTIVGCGGPEPAPAAAAPAPPPPPLDGAPPPRAPEPIELVRTKVSQVSFTDVRGHVVSLAELHRDGPLVIVLTSLRCPIARLYAPDLADRAARLATRLLVVEVAGASRDDLLAAAERHGWVDPIVVAADDGLALARELGAERTTECFVVDRQGDLRYRGAIDDQYGQGYRRPAPRNRYLEDALAAVLAGQPVAVEATSAPGCALAP